jgi:hypothetical protein
MIAVLLVTTPIPVTTPVPLTVATPPLLLVHVLPPATGVPLSCIVDPAQTTVGPVISLGNGFTVKISVAEHPVPVINQVIVDVPATRPEIRPPPVIVATVVLLLNQPPPAVASFTVIWEPTQTAAPPVIGVIGLTMIAETVA